MFHLIWFVVAVAIVAVVVVAGEQQLRVADVSSRNLQTGQVPTGAYFQLLEYTDSTCTILTYGQITVLNSCEL